MPIRSLTKRANIGLQPNVPSFEAYSDSLAAQRRAAAASHILTQEEPDVPVLPRRSIPSRVAAWVFGMSDEERIRRFGTANVATCIYTATKQFNDKGAVVTGNKTFRDNPIRYGFEKIPYDSLKNGDLVQFMGREFLGSVPHHAVLVTEKDSVGNPLFSYSNGNIEPFTIEENGDTTYTMKKNQPLEVFGTWKPEAYRYVGSPEQRAEWLHDYTQQYGNPLDNLSLPQNEQTVEYPDALRVIQPNLKAGGGVIKSSKLWNELSMKEKSEIMKVAVQNGIYSLSDIKQRYNEFAEGGDINNKYPIGGYIDYPANSALHNTGAAIRHNVASGIRQRLYENITPFGYHNPISRTFNSVVRNLPDDTRESENRRISDSNPEASALDAIWATYLNIPEGQRRKIDSRYGISKTKDGYYRFNNPGMIFNFEQDLSPQGLYSLPKRKAVMMNGILGNYTVGLGRDSKGDYMFYSDSSLNPDGTPNIKTGWDVNPYSNTVDNATEETTEEHGQYGQDKKNLSYRIGKALFGNKEDLSMGIGTPVPIYDRIYLDDYYDVPEENRGATYLPEIVVLGKKHSFGGPLVEDALNEYRNGGKIHIAPSKRGTFTAAAKRHGKSVQEFASQVLAHKGNYSPAMVKKANFARNASKWKHGLGGFLDEI